MARNLPIPNEERNPTSAEVQASNAAADAARAQQQQGGSVQVIDAAPIRTVDMSPPGRSLDALPDMANRHVVDASVSAPIVRSALDVPLPKVARTGTAIVMQGASGEAEEVKPPVERKYRVEKTIMVLDSTSGSRVRLPEGKEISNKHYPIRRLQQRGAKLTDITDLDPNAPI